MATTDDVLTQVSELLARLNGPEKKAGAISEFLKHPIVITVVGSILIAYGSNFVTKEFQLRDKQSEAVAALESAIPREIALTTQLAMISSVLEEQQCSENPGKKLLNPLVFGLTGKSCKEAEVEYLKFYALSLEHPPGSSLVKVRALFASPAVDEGAKKLGALIGLLSVTAQSSCIVQVARQADQAYGELVDLSIQEIDGSKVNKLPDIFRLTDLPAHCRLEDLCRIAAIAKDPSLKLKCA